MIDVSPFISRIAIFPIKSLDAVEVSSAHLLASGALADDRWWAMFDDRGRFVNSKNHVGVHRIRSRFDLDARTVTLRVDGKTRVPEAAFAPDGAHDAMEAWLDDALGFAVHLRTDETTGHPDDTHSPQGCSTLLDRLC